MRFGLVLCTPALFLTSVCWSGVDIPMPYLPSVDAAFKSYLKDIPDVAAVLSPQSKNVTSNVAGKPQSYPLSLQVFGTSVIAQITIPATGEQLAEIDLTDLRHRKKLSSQASTHLEKLLSLLALIHPNVQIHFDASTQTATLYSGSSVIETEVITKDTTRDDLPVLLEEDAVKQMFLAVECAQAAGELSNIDMYSCYSGSLQYQRNGRLTFEARPEYLPAPAPLETYQTDGALQFPLNVTTQVVLTLNNNGSIAWGDTYSFSIDMSSGTPRVAPQGQSNKGGKKGGRKGTSPKRTVIFYIGAGSGSEKRSSQANAGGAGGEPPEDPNNGQDKTPAGPVFFPEFGENEEKRKKNIEDLKWALGLQWPKDKKRQFIRSLSREERRAILGTDSSEEDNDDSGYDGSHESLQELDDVDALFTYPKGRSQWGSGELRSAGQKSRSNTDYVNNGRNLKAPDEYGDDPDFSND